MEGFPKIDWKVILKWWWNLEAPIGSRKRIPLGKSNQYLPIPRIRWRWPSQQIELQHLNVRDYFAIENWYLQLEPGEWIRPEHMPGICTTDYFCQSETLGSRPGSLYPGPLSIIKAEQDILYRVRRFCNKENISLSCGGANNCKLTRLRPCN